MTAARRWLAPLLLLTVLLPRCGKDVIVGSDPAGLSDAAPGEEGGAAADGSASACRVTYCQAHVYACGDCVDNDQDGPVDMDDPDCLGPCHDAEDSFAPSIPGQNRAPCIQDCYFDQDTGAGNDQCLWSHQCDPLEVAPDFAPAGEQCAYVPDPPLPRGLDCTLASTSQPSECGEACLPLTPNGCDCFGCCAIPGAPGPVWVGSTDDQGAPCDLAHVAEPARCRPCTQVESCLNPCESCELCVGKQELPSACAGVPAAPCPSPLCPSGRAPCGTPCLPACSVGESCITGCCVAAPP